jgi:hypothetical protein
MKKLVQILVLAFTLAGALSVPVLADTYPYPTQPPTKT